MRAAEGKLQAQAANDALPPEKPRAQTIAEGGRRIREAVSPQRGGGGGGGGERDPYTEDLAELFKQDLVSSPTSTRRRKALSSSSRESTARRADGEAARAARRQQQEAERQRSKPSRAACPGRRRQSARACDRRKAARQLRPVEGAQSPRPGAGSSTDAAGRRCDATSSVFRRSEQCGSGKRALGQLRERSDASSRNRRDRGQRDRQNAQQQADEIAREIVSCLGGDVGHRPAADARSVRAECQRKYNSRRR